MRSREANCASWVRNPGLFVVAPHGQGSLAAAAPSPFTWTTSAMRIITADETGLVKVVRLESSECLSVSAGEQGRARAVRAICRRNALDASTSPSHQADYCLSVHVARSAGTVETWDMSQSERGGTNGNACSLSLRGALIEGPQNPVALASLPPPPGSSEHSRVVTCNGDGEVQVSCAGSGGADETSKRSKFTIRGPISAATVIGTGTAGLALAAGGRENDLKIWDVNTAQCTWKAKNVPHDFLDMRQPVWISSLCSLLPEADGGSGGGGNGAGLPQIVAGTAHRQVRLYDARAHKRPTHSVDADEHGITALAVAPEGREVVVADTAGLVRVLDLRKMKWGRRFEGPAGSVRGLAFHPTLPVLACVGLDRMARIYDYRTREQKFQVYLKQRLNAVLFEGEGEIRVAAGTADAEDQGKGGRYSGKVEDWSGSEGWGSGEEYEMDDGDSSEEEEEEREHAVLSGKRGGVAANGSRSAVGEDSDGESGEDESSEEESDSEEDESSGGGGEGNSSNEVDDESDDESESDEEDRKAQTPPPKRQNVQSGSNKSKRSRR